MLVFVDTNVWFPIRIADLILRSAEWGLLQIAWTDHSLLELERILVREKGLDLEKARKFIEEIRKTAPEGKISASEYRPLVAEMQGPDPDDYLFSAAARAGNVDVLLTENLRDFPQQDLGSQTRAITPDVLFCELLSDFPAELLFILAEMSAHLKRPSLSQIQVLDLLAKAGMVNFAGEMKKILT